MKSPVHFKNGCLSVQKKIKNVDVQRALSRLDVLRTERIYDPLIQSPRFSMKKLRPTKGVPAQGHTATEEAGFQTPASFNALPSTSPSVNIDGFPT